MRRMVAFLLTLVTLLGMATGIAEEAAYEPVDSKSTGEIVEKLQTRLTELGWYFGEITGVYDKDTQTAWRYYEQANEWKPNGKAEAEELAAFYADDAKRGPTDEEAIQLEVGTIYDGTYNRYYSVKFRNMSLEKIINACTYEVRCFNAYEEPIPVSGSLSEDMTRQDIVDFFYLKPEKYRSVKRYEFAINKEATHVDVRVIRYHTYDRKTVEIPDAQWSSYYLRYHEPPQTEAEDTTKK